MTRFTHNLVAASAALVIVALTWAPLVNIPPAQASQLLTAPVLA